MHDHGQEAFAVCKVFLGNHIKKILNTRDSVSCGEFENQNGKYLIKKGHEADDGDDDDDDGDDDDGDDKKGHEASRATMA